MNKKTHSAASNDLAVYLADLQPRLAVSPSEAAKMAGIGRTRLYQSLSNGDLPSFKIGSRRLIRITELDRWLSSFEQKETPDNSGKA